MYLVSPSFLSLFRYVVRDFFMYVVRLLYMCVFLHFLMFVFTYSVVCCVIHVCIPLVNWFGLFYLYVSMSLLVYVCMSLVI